MKNSEHVAVAGLPPVWAVCCRCLLLFWLSPHQTCPQFPGWPYHSYQWPCLETLDGQMSWNAEACEVKTNKQTKTTWKLKKITSVDKYSTILTVLFSAIIEFFHGKNKMLWMWQQSPPNKTQTYQRGSLAPGQNLPRIPSSSWLSLPPPLSTQHHVQSDILNMHIKAHFNKYKSKCIYEVHSGGSTGSVSL